MRKHKKETVYFGNASSLLRANRAKVLGRCYWVEIREPSSWHLGKISWCFSVLMLFEYYTTRNKRGKISITVSQIMALKFHETLLFLHWNFTQELYATDVQWLRRVERGTSTDVHAVGPRQLRPPSPSSHRPHQASRRQRRTVLSATTSSQSSST